jgi:endoglucanase
MLNIPRLARLFALAWLAAASLSPALAQPDPAEQVRRLGRGVNVLGYDPIWDDPAQARFQPRHFGLIRAAGFRHIRLNLHAFAHMDAEGRLAPRWLETLDGVLAQARQAGLMVILDEHDFRACGEDAASCRTRLLAFWRQVGERYRDAPDGLLFELLNEPNRALDAAGWNALLAEALAVVRASNPRRTVLIGPAMSNSPRALPALAWPRGDGNLVLTVHYYDPFRFTHQGAAWARMEGVSGIRWGSPEERRKVAADFDEVQAWARAHGTPVLLGEFGAYEKGEMADRAAWTAAVARAAEAQGWAWSYWQFTSSFDVYDLRADRWVQPILEALIPSGPAR